MPRRLATSLWDKGVMNSDCIMDRANSMVDSPPCTCNFSSSRAKKDSSACR